MAGTAVVWTLAMYAYFGDNLRYGKILGIQAVILVDDCSCIIVLTVVAK